MNYVRCLLLFCLTVLSIIANGLQTNPGFVRNDGQLYDLNGKTVETILYYYSDGNFRIFIRPDGISYELQQLSALHSPFSEGGSLGINPETETTDYFQVNADRFDLSFSNCNTHCQIEASDRMRCSINFINLKNKKQIIGVPCYQKITFHELYEGVDLIFFLEENSNGGFKPKYEFLVKQPGSESRISLKYNGKGFLHFIDGGSIQYTLNNGFVQESEPIVLSRNRQTISIAEYNLKDNTISFRLPIELKDTFIIDPYLSWGTYYGGAAADVSEEIKTDAEGNIYVAGRTSSTNNFATSGSYQSSYSGGVTDAFLLKMSSDGTLEWATYYGGSSSEYCFALTIADEGDIYIGGETKSNSGIATAGAHQISPGGIEDGFVAKFNSSGLLLWGTYYGGTNKDQVLGLCCDHSGSVYATGYTKSTNQIATAGAHKTSLTDTQGDGFLVKFDSMGTRIYGTYYGGSGQDRGHSLAVDQQGNLFMVGTTPSTTDISTPGAYQTTLGGNSDIFIVKFSPSGVRQWCTYFGGLGVDRGRECETDLFGNIYLTGIAESSDNFTTNGVFQPNHSYDSSSTPNDDAIVAKFSNSGSLIWCTYYGGSANEAAKGLKVHPLGYCIVISGTTYSNDNIATTDALQKVIGGSNDAYFAIINSSATQKLFSTYYGGAGIEESNGYGPAVAADFSSNQFYLTSCTNSTDSIATSNAYLATLQGDFDNFIVNIIDSCRDLFEVNNNFTSAFQLFPSQPSFEAKVKGTIAYAGDKDNFYFFNSVLQPHIQITLSSLPANYNLYLYDSSKNFIAKSTHHGIQNDQITFNNGYVGRYYVLVKTKAAYNASSCYELLISTSSTPYQFLAENSATKLLDEDGIEIYPNPVNSLLNICLPAIESSSGQLNVFDVSGHFVYHQICSEYSNQPFQLDISEWPKGFYILSYSSAFESYKGSFIIN